MTIPSGSRLGPYEVLAPIGAGGMGEVYRARDTRLGRDVAIKVLPAAFAQDAERLARFQREAQILATLNHPHIAQIHGLEETGDTRALVLELVEGTTLSERLARGPLPVQEALDTCRQIALALEAAHESGVIHRDLKPGNVKITAGGEVKVLDFGLAKGAPGSGSASDLNLTHSPTMTQAATQAGVVLGTAAYMSPEQARGKPVDRRTDIWSFGCVLYECLTGRQAFEGETISDMIARILEREPDWSALPARTPARVRELLARCLEKDAKKRLRDIGDARIEIESALAARSSSGAIRAEGAAADAEATGAAPSRSERIVSIALGAAGGALLAALALTVLRPAAPPREAPVAHLSITIPDGLRVRGAGCSPDGALIGIIGAEAKPAAGKEPVTRIYLRRLDEVEFKPLPGSEGVLPGPPQFSPDGRSIYFLARARTEGSPWKLLRAPIDGSSPPVTICEWPDGWQGFRITPKGDFLVMADRGASVLRLPASGSPPGPVIPIDGGDFKATYRGLDRGDWVGDDQLLLESISYGSRGWVIGVAALNATTGKVTQIVEEGGFPKLLDDGHILFTRNDAMLAAPFDARKMALTATPVSVLGGLGTVNPYEPAPYLLASNGMLLYNPGGRAGADRRVAFLGVDGKIDSTLDEEKSFREPSALPDGRRVAVTATNSRGIDEIWVTDTGRPGLRRYIAIPGADCAAPLWSPNGDRLAFVRSANDEESGLYVQKTDAADESRTLVVRDSAQINYLPTSWSADGSRLLVVAGRPGADDIMLLTLPAQGSRQFTALIATPANETAPALSPDGRWVAYTSDESGQDEVYVRALRADGSAGSAIPVSRGPGANPGWIDGGTRIGYIGTDQHLRFVSVKTEPTLSLSPPVEGPDLSGMRLAEGSWLPDGRSVVIVQGKNEGEVSHIEVVLNWTEELRARLAAEARPSK